ncbi:MAG: endo-1,4-beta-xylanase [Kiritimatiellae bacterium]|nr:endo-1,4-beta-xylanase [Kiritimatiellia bacterium]
MTTKATLALFAALAAGLAVAQDIGAGLKDAARPYFRFGTTLDRRLIHPDTRSAAELEAITGTFDTITPENELKPERLLKGNGEYDFSDADRFVEFGESNAMRIIGHCLVWHMQTPAWMHTAADGTPLPREEAIENLRSHIMTVVGRYRGRIYGWDVVNEAWMEDGTLRDCGWRRAIGDDYIELAFRFAHEADPDCELYYNDYAMAERAKCDAIIGMVGDLRAKGVRIDAVGFQTHVSLWYPDISAYAKSMDDMIAAGIRFNVTEMDVGVLPDPAGDDLKNLYPSEGLPDGVQARLTERYTAFFTEFLKRHEWIDRVTFWGVTDAQSWLNYYPVRGRINHPLLFDRQARAKPVVAALHRLMTGWKNHGPGMRVAEMPRITSLEAFAERAPAAFTDKAIAYAKDAGYNAVFVNGGCGFGSDAMPPESLAVTGAIPDLMPYTAERNIRELKERIRRLSDAGMKPWLCWWTGVGTDEKGNLTDPPNIRSRREIYAKYRKNPELFGAGPWWRWRGNRPLCISNPKVREFYRELFSRLPKDFPELEGLFFFPGDAELENCTDECETCRASGLGRVGRMVRFANEIYDAWNSAADKKRAFYYAFWNLDQPGGDGQILSSVLEETLPNLAAGMGIAMSICDNTVERRVTGDIILNQPWGTCNSIGSLFRAMIDSPNAKGRPVMAVSEISQSELFDPVCANMPFAVSTLELMHNLRKIPNCDAVVDFWGNRPPYGLSDASHEVMKGFMDVEISGGEFDDGKILLDAAARHYGDAALAEKGVAA